jgi:hypothetical protein
MKVPDEGCSMLDETCHHPRTAMQRIRALEQRVEFLQRILERAFGQRWVELMLAAEEEMQKPERPLFDESRGEL